MERIVFIHGMFQNAKSWSAWQSYFQARGFATSAPSWPYHEGEPAELRRHPPEGLGGLHLQKVIGQFAELVAALPEKPVLIGHSVGGLIVQELASLSLIKAGVCISSVAPNRMLAFDWGFFKNSVAITNPIAGDAPFTMTPEGFHGSFANTLSLDASDAAYERTATHDSRNVLRDCMLEDGKVDVDLPHPPLLFIAAEKDHIIPPELNAKNAKAYSDKSSIVGFKEFPNRGHFICGEPNWEEVAAYSREWIEITLASESWRMHATG
jgi:pimeloyl-ACP methyl ester carboxylesterase